MRLSQDWQAVIYLWGAILVALGFGLAVSWISALAFGLTGTSKTVIIIMGTLPLAILGYVGFYRAYRYVVRKMRSDA